MNLEPQKFFIGVIDFFSILMPGALLAYLGSGWIAGLGLAPPGVIPRPAPGVETVAVFLFVSYLLGHLVFLIGATLDDLVEDRLRKLTDRKQISRLAEGKGMSARWLRRPVKSQVLFKKHPDKAVIIVERLKASALDPFEAARAVNAFQWCKSLLSKEHSEGLAAVQRFEADSKFFRSFVVVLAA